MLPRPRSFIAFVTICSESAFDGDPGAGEGGEGAGRRTLLFGEYMNERLQLRLPHRQIVYTFPKALEDSFAMIMASRAMSAGWPTARCRASTARLQAGGFKVLR